MHCQYMAPYAEACARPAWHGMEGAGLLPACQTVSNFSLCWPHGYNMLPESLL